MSKYPEWLIRKVAEAGARGVDDCGGLYNGHSAQYVEEWEKGAVVILDALDFREDQSFGVLSEGFLMTGFMVKDSPNYGRVTRWRSILPWRKDEG